MCPSLRQLLILLTLGCLSASGDTRDTLCPDSWTAFRTSCYQFVNYSRSFVGAQHWCEKGGGHLVIVADEETQLFLQTHLDPPEDFWVGLSQTHPFNSSSQGPLQWVDGSDITYSNWVTAPQAGSLCGYVLRNSSFQWEATRDCSRTLHFICQLETMRAVECRGSNSILQCQSGQVLTIDVGFFGRESQNDCPSTLSERNTVCPSVEVTDRLTVLCQGRQACRVGGFFSSLDEPCPAIESYLSVDYHCQHALSLSLAPAAAVFTSVTIEVKWLLRPEENLGCSLNTGDGHVITLDADRQGHSMAHQYSEAGDFTVTAECTNEDMHVTAQEKITLLEPVSEFAIIKCISGSPSVIDTDCQTIYGGLLEIQTAVKTGTDVSYTLLNGDMILASMAVSRGNVPSNMSVSDEKVRLLGPGCHQLTLQASNIVTVPHVTTNLQVCILERIAGLRAEILINKSSCWSNSDFTVRVSVDSGSPVTLDFTLIGQQSCTSEIRDMTARTDIFQIQNAFKGSIKLTIRAWNLFSSAEVDVEHVGCDWTMNDINDFFSSYLSEQHIRVKRQAMEIFAQPSNEVFDKNYEITLSLDAEYHRKPDRTYRWSCEPCKCEGPWATETHVITRECLPRPFHYFIYYLNEYKDGLLEHSEPICVTLTPLVVLPVNLTCVEGCEAKTITLANISMTCESECPEVTWYIEDPRDSNDWNTTTRTCHEENNTRPLIDGQEGGSEYLVNGDSLAWAQSENQDIVVVVTTDEDEPRYQKLTIEQPSSSSSSQSSNSKSSKSSSKSSSSSSDSSSKSPTDSSSKSSSDSSSKSSESSTDSSSKSSSDSSSKSSDSSSKSPTDSSSESSTDSSSKSSSDSSSKSSPDSSSKSSDSSSKSSESSSKSSSDSSSELSESSSKSSSDSSSKSSPDSSSKSSDSSSKSSESSSKSSSDSSSELSESSSKSSSDSSSKSSSDSSSKSSSDSSSKSSSDSSSESSESSSKSSSDSSSKSSSDSSSESSESSSESSSKSSESSSESSSKSSPDSSSKSSSDSSSKSSESSSKSSSKSSESSSKSSPDSSSKSSSDSSSKSSSDSSSKSPSDSSSQSSPGSSSKSSSESSSKSSKSSSESSSKSSPDSSSKSSSDSASKSSESSSKSSKSSSESSSKSSSDSSSKSSSDSSSKSSSDSSSKSPSDSSSKSSPGSSSKSSESSSKSSSESSSESSKSSSESPSKSSPDSSSKSSESSSKSSKSSSESSSKSSSDSSSKSSSDSSSKSPSDSSSKSSELSSTSSPDSSSKSSELSPSSSSSSGSSESSSEDTPAQQSTPAPPSASTPAPTSVSTPSPALTPQTSSPTPAASTPTSPGGLVCSAFPMVGSVLEPFNIYCETVAPCPDCQYCFRIEDERLRCSADHSLQNIYLPVGNRMNDYNLVITVTAKVHCFEVKTTITPQVTDLSLCVQKLKEIVEHLDELWNQGLMPDDTAARLLVIAANMLNDKIDDESKPDREELREQILDFIADIIAKTPSWTPEEVAAIAGALNPVVQRADELSSEAQEDAALALKTLSLFLLQTTGNKDEEFKNQMQIAAGTLVEVASNMTEFPPSKRVSETLFDALNNTQSALLGLNELDGWPLIIKKDHICMLVNRVKADDLEKVSADLLDNSCARFTLPDLSNIAPGGEAVNIKVLSLGKNIFSWNKRGNISGVIGSLSMTAKNGTVIPLRDLKEDIEIRLPRPLGEPVNVTVLDLRNFSTTIIDIPLKDSTLVIKIVPSEDPLPLKLYLGYLTYPTEQKHLAVTLMPHQGSTIEERYSWLLHPKDLKGKAGIYYLLVRPIVGPGIKHITGNLSITTFGASCKFWNESLLDWDDYGCRVGLETSHEAVHCFCNHLTFFGSSFFVTPNLVDPSRTAELFGTFGENPVVVCFVGALFLVYLLLLAWARWKDVRDKAKVKVTVLDDNNPMDEYRYLLCVNTGLRRGASTSSLVTVYLVGSEGSSEPHHLVNSKTRLFGRGMVDMFLLTTPFSLGELQAIRLWHNNSGNHPAWYVSQVMVQDLQTRQKWNVLCSSWLAIDMDDCCLDKVFPVSTDADLKKFSNLFYMKTTKDFCDGHLWYSVINGPPRSSFTCVQRVSCCFSLLLCTMLTSIMFYGIPTDPAEQTLDLGAFEFTWQQFMIGVQSSLIMFPVNILIVSIFRYTRPRKTPCCRRKRKQKDKVEHDNISRPCSVSFESIAQDIVRISQSLSDCKKSNAEYSDGKQVNIITALSEVENYIRWNSKRSEAHQPGADNVMDPPHPLPDGSTSIHLGSKLDGNEMRSTKSHYLYRQLCQIERRLCQLGPSGFPSEQSFVQTQGKVQRMKTLLEHELHTSSNDLPQKRENCEDGDGALKKRSCCHAGLPWWFVFVGWFLVISTSVVAGYFTMLYGLKFGKDRSISWLTSMLISFFQSILVIQPLKVLCLAVFFALVIKKIEDDQMDELAFVRPSPEAVKREAWHYAPPLPVDIEVMKRNKVKEQKAYALMTEILIYLFFMWMLLLVAHGQRDQNAFFLNRHVRQSFSRGISDSMSVQDVFTWANTSLLHNLFGVHPGFITDGNSKLVGNARLRQVRVKTRSCETAESMSQTVPSCHAPYSWEAEDTGRYKPNWSPFGQDQHRIAQNTSDPWKYQTESELRSHSVRGKILLYRGGGFVTELGPDFHRATRILTDLFKSKWLDSYTRAIFIEFTVYNANVNLFCIVTLLLETAAVGAFEFQSELQTIRLYTSTDGFSIFIMATEITYMLFILYFMFQQGKLLKQKGREYFRSKWNLLELAIILLSWCAVAAFIARAVLGDQDLTFYQKNKKLFASFHNTAVADHTLQYLIAFIVLLACVKLWHLLRLNPKMNMLTATLQRAWPDLCGFALVILIMIIAYSITSNLIYGWEISSYKTFITAVMTIIKMQVGIFNYDEVLEHSPVLGALLFGSCIVFMTFVVLNLLISVILVAFNMEQLYHQPSEEEEIVDLMLKKICSLFGIKYNPSKNAPPIEDHSGGHVVLHDQPTSLHQS